LGGGGGKCGHAKCWLALDADTGYMRTCARTHAQCKLHTLNAITPCITMTRPRDCIDVPAHAHARSGQGDRRKYSMARRGVGRGKGAVHARLRHAFLRRSLCDAALLAHASYALALNPQPQPLAFQYRCLEMDW